MSTDELRELLRGYCERVPPAINSGSYNLAVAFKANVAAARKVLMRRNASQSDLRAQISRLHNYWERKS